MNNKKAKCLGKLTKREVRSALIGMLLGDGYIRTNLRKGRSNKNVNGSLVIKHSQKQELYLNFKTDFVKTYLPVSSSTSREIIKSPNSDNLVYTVASIFSRRKEFTRLRNQMYKPKKEVSKEIANELTPLAMYFWYLDDGNLNVFKRNTRSYQVKLHTEGFSIDSIINLRKAVKMKFDIKLNIVKKIEGQYILLCSSKEVRKFMRLLEPYRTLVPSMEYKFLSYYNLLYRIEDEPSLVTSADIPNCVVRMLLNVHNNRRKVASILKMDESTIRFRLGLKKQSAKKNINLQESVAS